MKLSTPPKICISGAAHLEGCGPLAGERARELGSALASSGAVILTGATTGFPLLAAQAAKEAGGTVIGFSPAGSEKEHREVYHLPTEYHDVVVYTGFGYAGSELLLARSADAVCVGCGRIGAIHEFTVAFSEGKPVGVLEGPWKTDDMVKELIVHSGRATEHVVFEEHPAKLTSALLKTIARMHAEEHV
ncbi:MAG: LOG family protein [Parcubacteria group bacterium]|nr:LOG family protein [Parcubacteria group bacterium]